MSTSIERVLIANRGEIAVRIIRTLRQMGIGSVAVYSDADARARHVRMADHAVRIGPPPAAQSYLDVEAVLAAAEATGADAIHPGYGFLAENAAFAQACIDAGITWIGPPPSAIEAMGTKTASRELMQQAGVPIVPGTTDPVASLGEAREVARQVGYPVAVKAASGGGGKGFRVALDADGLEAAFHGASGEGERFFADPTVYIERYLPNPRHVEVQVLADTHGAVVHLGERDCTLQRRHQKLVEESPSPALDDAQRELIGRIGTDAARAVGYEGAGTIECLASEDGEVFFLEMNTRIQVEHPVTELVTGIDLVEQQLRIAAGEPLGFGQDDIRHRGHAIECRINAEDAWDDYRPASGTIRRWREPSGPWVRVDSGVEAGDAASAFYDNLLAKVITWGETREDARRRMLAALAEFEVDGVETLVDFHRALLATDDFIAGAGCHATCADPRAHLERPAAVATHATLPASQALARDIPTSDRRELAIEVDGQRYAVTLLPDAIAAGADTPQPRSLRPHVGAASGADGAVTAPIPGTIVALDVTEGDQVEAGQRLCVLEAMKMENEIAAPGGGVVEAVEVEAGTTVTGGQVLLRIGTAV